MPSRTYESFFLASDDALQRRYEVLRAVHVEQLPMNEVAECFEISHGTVRNWVSEFRQRCDAGQRPLFSFSHAGVARPHRKMTPTSASRLPMYENCRYSRSDVSPRGMRDYFCFCRCWRACASMAW